MSLLLTLPLELFPEILKYASTADLKSYTLVNSTFQSLAQPGVFSVIRMLNEVNNRLALFDSERGRLLLKHVQSLVLGLTFWHFRDHNLTSSFLQALADSSIHTLHLHDINVWDEPPGKTLHTLYTTVMPRLRSLVFSDMDDIPLTKILTHSPLMQHIEFNSFTTSRNDSEIDLGTLPQIQSLAIIFWDISNLASSTSLGAYLKEKGSHIESLSIGMFFEDRSRIPCTMDLFLTLKPSLRHVRFDAATLQSLVQNPPLRFNELPNLTTLFFTIDLKYVPWSVFHHFLDQHIKQECLPPTLAEIYVQVDVLGEWSLSFSNSVAASTGNPRPLVLPSNWQICLHVGICINKGNGGTEGSATKRIFERYDELQKAIESQLCMWSQADQLRVTRHYGSNIPW